MQRNPLKKERKRQKKKDNSAHNDGPLKTDKARS